jgi:hypothetical protein
MEAKIAEEVSKKQKRNTESGGIFAGLMGGYRRLNTSAKTITGVLRRCLGHRRTTGKCQVRSDRPAVAAWHEASLSDPKDGFSDPKLIEIQSGYADGSTPTYGVGQNPSKNHTHQNSK